MDKTITGSYRKGKGETRSIIASTPGIDRDGEKIATSAWSKSLSRYLTKNPVILWGHDYNIPPVGKAVGGKITDGALLLDVEFAPTREGQDVKTLYDGGFLNSFSVGFIPKNATSDQDGTRTYTDCELLEVSCVTVPSNPDAVMLRSVSPKLRKAFDKGTEKGNKMSDMISYDEHLRLKGEAVREAERMAKARRADASEPGQDSAGYTNLSVGTPGEHKGVRVKEVMARMAANAKSRGADDYLNRNPEGAEVAAVFWIDKVLGAKANTKANEIVTTTDSLGGYLTPTEQEGAVLDYMRYTSVALQDATVIPMGSDKMTVPVAGTAPAITIESDELTISQATPTFGQTTLTANRHSGYIPVSWEMEADNTASLAAFLADKFYEDLGKTIDSAIFHGPGTLVNGSGVFQNYSASSVLASAAFSSVTADDLYDAVGALAGERRTGAKWYFKTANFWANVAKLTHDSVVRMYDPTVNKILGHNVREIWNGPDSGTGNVLGIFGNLKTAIIGSRLMSTQLKRIENRDGTTDYVFFTRLAYANPLPGSFVGLVAA